MRTQKETEYYREYQRQHRKHISQYNIVRRFEAKKKAIAHKGGVCVSCNGAFHPAAMDFHHLDPTQKDFEIGNRLGRTWEKIVPELEKCILLCANCHRIRHYEDGK